MSKNIYRKDELLFVEKRIINSDLQSEDVDNCDPFHMEVIHDNRTNTYLLNVEWLSSKGNRSKMKEINHLFPFNQNGILHPNETKSKGRTRNRQSRQRQPTSNQESEATRIIRDFFGDAPPRVYKLFSSLHPSSASNHYTSSFF